MNDQFGENPRNPFFSEEEINFIAMRRLSTETARKQGSPYMQADPYGIMPRFNAASSDAQDAFNRRVRAAMDRILSEQASGTIRSEQRAAARPYFKALRVLRAEETTRHTPSLQSVNPMLGLSGDTVKKINELLTDRELRNLVEQCFDVDGASEEREELTNQLREKRAALQTLLPEIVELTLALDRSSYRDQSQTQALINYLERTLDRIEDRQKNGQ